MLLSNKVYDLLKYIAMTALPALNAMWLTLSMIWNFPYGEAIGATIGAINVFLGALLGLSNTKYNLIQNLTEEDEQAYEEFENNDGE